jgi:hypothetical protein
MMGRHAVDHSLGFAVSLEHLRANQGVRAFDLVINRLANIVEKSGPLGGGNIETEFDG